MESKIIGTLLTDQSGQSEMSLVQEYRGFLTIKDVSTLVKILYKNKVVTLYVFYRSRDGLTKKLSENKNLVITKYHYGFYLIRNILPKNSNGSYRSFIEGSDYKQRDILSQLEKIPNHPLQKYGPVNEKGFKKLYLFRDGFMNETTTWVKASVKLSHYYKHKEDTKKRHKEWCKNYITMPLIISLLAVTLGWVVNCLFGCEKILLLLNLAK